MAGNLVGIDLGTTFSALATLDDHGQPVIVSNSDNQPLTPSAVLLLEDGTAVVGQAALDEAQVQPGRAALLVKRRMGEKSFGHPVAGRDFRPETLSAIILRKMVQDAEARIGPIARAVITVPAYFDESRRKATKDAGRIAGLDVLDILDEPTAAALAYSFQPSRPGGGAIPAEGRTVLVYDLGGGTFDVALVRLEKNRFQTLAIEGDVRLGGKDWDDAIVDHAAGLFQRQHGVDPRTDPLSLMALRVSAERAKRSLSKLAQTTLNVTHGGRVMSVPLTRAEFESLTRPLLVRTRLTCQQVVRQAGLAWDKVDRVLLVGGSTHMPMTGLMLQELTGKAADSSLAVSEVVARGAALHAGIVAAHSQEDAGLLGAGALDLLGDVVEINVNAHSLGIEARDSTDMRVSDVLIPKNTMLPCAASRVYYTKTEGQQRVRVKVLQGEAREADHCIQVGECWIDGLPAGMPKGSPVQVRCGVASNGLIDVMALDMTSGKIAHSVIHRSSGLTDDEIAHEAEFVRGLRIQ